MTHNTGPTYRDWLEVLAHTANYSYEELHSIAERIEDQSFSRLTQSQRVKLLSKLGDLQITAARREDRLSA